DAVLARFTTLFLVVALVGCEKKADEPKQEAPAEAEAKAKAPAAEAPPAAATPVAATPDAAAPPFLPPAIDKKSGIIFAEKAGGTVKGIKDGTVVEVVGESGGAVADMADATVTVKHEGRKVKLRADRVLRDIDVEQIRRSPDNQYAVFSPIYACGDVCHSVLWLISARDGKRVKLGEGGPDVEVAWHPKGGTVAAGSGGLWIVSLADYKVKELEEYTSPAYSPDGTLYVRDHEGSAFIVGKGKPKKVWDAGGGDDGGDEGADEEEDVRGVDDPRPVRFEGGKPEFGLDYIPAGQ
ncbi:MAG TPA: hypothetical protein VFU21_09110, partial [Kofleriaceae bacterium]|nr:hypothetical protein [Kofleriaceae bacterium]